MGLNDSYNQRRERLLNAVRFKPTDRVPVHGGNGTIAALQALSGRNDYPTRAKEVYAEAMKKAGVDLVMQFVLPDRQDRQIGPMAEVAVYDGLLSVLYGFLDQWIEKHGPMGSPEDLRDFCLTVPAAERAGDYVDPEKTAQRWVDLNAWGEFLKPIVWMPGHLCGKVSWMWYGSVGYENYLMAHLLYPDEIERLFAFEGEEGRLRNAAIARAVRRYGLLPVVYLGEDICGNDGPLCSPDVLRRVYFPHLRRALEPLVDDGIHMLWHSDGNITPILPDLMACGVDGYQGFEEDKGMDLHALAETPCRNGGLPVLCGSVSVSTTFYEGPGAVRADVQRMVELSHKRGGGVILSPSSSMMENMPVENVLAFYAAALDGQINRA